MHPCYTSLPAKRSLPRLSSDNDRDIFLLRIAGTAWGGGGGRVACLRAHVFER